MFNICSIYSPASLKADTKELNKPLFQQSESAASAGQRRPAQVSRSCSVHQRHAAPHKKAFSSMSRAVWEMLKVDWWKEATGTRTPSPSAENDNRIRGQTFEGGPGTFRPVENEFGSRGCPGPVLEPSANPISHCVTGSGLFQCSL